MPPGKTSPQANTDDKDEPMPTASSDKESNISSQDFSAVQVSFPQALGLIKICLCTSPHVSASEPATTLFLYLFDGVFIQNKKERPTIIFLPAIPGFSFLLFFSSGSTRSHGLPDHLPPRYNRLERSMGSLHLLLAPFGH